MISHLMDTLFEEYFKIMYNYWFPNFYIFEERSELYKVASDLDRSNRLKEIDRLEESKIRMIEFLSKPISKKHRYKLLFHIGIIENNIYKHKQLLVQ